MRPCRRNRHELLVLSWIGPLLVAGDDLACNKRDVGGNGKLLVIEFRIETDEHVFGLFGFDGVHTQLLAFAHEVLRPAHVDVGEAFAMCMQGCGVSARENFAERAVDAHATQLVEDLGSGFGRVVGEEEY